VRPSGWILLALTVLVVLGVLCLSRGPGAEVPASAHVRATPPPSAAPTLSGLAGGAGTGVTPVASAPNVASAATNDVGSVEGTVTGWDGKPAAGLRVSLVAADEPVPPRREGRQWYVSDEPAVPRSTTDESGHYILRGIPREGDFVVVVRVSHTYEVRSGFLRFSDVRQRCDVPLPAPATVRVRLALPGGQRVKIRQLDVRGEFVWFALQPGEEPGEWPVEDGTSSNDLGAEWTLQMEDDGQVASIRTGPGPVAIHVWLDGRPLVERETTLVSGEVATLELTVPTEGVVRGRVVYPQGWPVVEATVSWEGDRLVSGDVDDAGVFRLSGVGRGKGTRRLQAYGGDAELLAVSLDDVVPDGSSLLVRLERVKPARVTALVGLPPGTKVSAAVLSRNRTGGVNFLVDEQGRFETKIPTDEPSLLVIPYDGMAPTLVDLPLMAPGARRDLGTLGLVPGVEMAGEVRDVEGKPVAGVEVAVAERWAHPAYVLPTTTDERGAFRIPHMPARPLLLRFRGGGFPQHLRRVDPSTSQRLEMVLTPGGIGDVRVVDPDGGAVPGATLTVLPVGDFPYDGDLDTMSRSVSLGAEGRAPLRMCVGPRRLKAWSKSGGRSEEVEVTIREGDTIVVTLVVRPAPSACATWSR